MEIRAEVGARVRELLRDLFDASRKGAPRDRLARAHGYADGYMRALLDTGLARREDLLVLVRQERAHRDARCGVAPHPASIDHSRMP